MGDATRMPVEGKTRRVEVPAWRWARTTRALSSGLTRAKTVVWAAAARRASSSARPDFPEVPVTERVVNEQPGATLVDASAGARLLVVGSRGRGGLTGLVLGSVSQGVLHQAHCPVAAVCPRSPAEEKQE